MADFKVTPWDVEGEVDYEKLTKQFGTQLLSDDLIKKIEKKAGSSHHMLRRKIFFSHRELDTLLKEDEFALYTGRGPSGHTHIGHLIPWMFTKYLQDAFNVPLYFQITDDEKYLCKKDLTLEETNALSFDNALDLIALGFKPKNTHIIIDTEYGKTMYKLAIKIAKKITASSAKAVFGFKDDTNIGMFFWPAMQAAPCFLPTELKGRKIRTLIPAAIDQDPFWRIARDVAPKLGYPKTAAIHCRFLPALTGPKGKMSTSSGAHTTIFTTDDAKTVKKKINKYAFSGGKDTLEDHRKYGGDTSIDVSYQWLTFLEPDDKKLKSIHDNYRSGKLLSGELKAILIDTINILLKTHRGNKEKAKKSLDKFLLRD